MHDRPSNRTGAPGEELQASPELRAVLPRESGVAGEQVPGAVSGSAASAGSDVGAILAQRGSRYGKFTDHAEVTQTLKAIFRARMGEKWDRLADDQKEALEMIAHKLGRIINGDPDYADSWVDIAGYSKLVADRLEGAAR